MSRSRILAIVVLVLLAAGHFSAYNILAGYLTELARDKATGADQARWMRLALQAAILADLMLFGILLLWLANWAKRVKELQLLRGAYADLHKELEMERQLADVDQRMHLMFETADIAEMLLGERGRVILANRKAADLLLLNRNKLSEYQLNDLLAPQARVLIEDLQRALREEGPQSVNVPLQRSDGTTLNAWVQLTPFEGPTGEALVSVLFRSVQPVEEVPAKVGASRLDTILVADDEELIRLLEKNMLVRIGYKPLLAAHGAEAVEIFQANRERIALVVLDLSMPVMNGLQAYERIREIDPDIPVLFCSGYTEDAFNVPLDGRQRLLRKPFRYEEFEEAINRTALVANK